MKQEIQEAVEAIRRGWPKAEVKTTEDGNGDVTVLVEPISIGDQYVPSESWIGFVLPHNYPDPDVYPHYIDGEVKRRDEKPLGESFGETDWQGRKVIQVSRRTNGWNGAVDSAEGKLIKVLDWIRSRR